MIVYFVFYQIVFYGILHMLIIYIIMLFVLVIVLFYLLIKNNISGNATEVGLLYYVVYIVCIDHNVVVYFICID